MSPQVRVSSPHAQVSNERPESVSFTRSVHAMQGPRLLSHSSGKTLSALSADDLAKATPSNELPSVPLVDLTPAPSPLHEQPPDTRRHEPKHWKEKWTGLSKVLWRHVSAS